MHASLAQLSHSVCGGVQYKKKIDENALSAPLVICAKHSGAIEWCGTRAAPNAGNAVRLPTEYRSTLLSSAFALKVLTTAHSPYDALFHEPRAVNETISASLPFIKSQAYLYT